jgi:3-oxoacyl-[acyl-carrier-protein] synthase II
MKLYINGSSTISPYQATGLLSVTENSTRQDDRLFCIEPDYDKIFDPSQIRRWSRILKMGLATTVETMRQAKNPRIDAIITGTGYGYTEDTVKFLLKMTDPEDRGMNPTSFIQSTYNTISSLIALNLKNEGYNNTFVHSEFSFESALDDAIMLLKSGEAINVLVGGIDELTNTVYELLKRLRKTQIRSKKQNSTGLPSDTLRFGEGSSFFVISEKPDHGSSVEITDFKILYKPDEDQIISLFEEITGNNKIDLFMLGEKVEKSNDESYNWIHSRTSNENCFNYIRLCGDYPTASAFGLWLAAYILSGVENELTSVKNPEGILIYNCSDYKYHSFLSLRRC